MISRVIKPKDLKQRQEGDKEIKKWVRYTTLEIKTHLEAERRQSRDWERKH